MGLPTEGRIYDPKFQEEAAGAEPSPVPDKGRTNLSYTPFNYLVPGSKLYSYFI